MKIVLSLLLTILAMDLCLADGPVIQTTPLTRQLLRAPDAGTARSVLGVFATNNWPVSNVVLYVPTMNQGTANGGTFNGGTNLNGLYTNGNFSGGNFSGGTNNNGVFTNGTYSGGNFDGNININGTFNGGTYSGGNFTNSNFSGTNSGISGLMPSFFTNSADEALSWAVAAKLSQNAQRDAVRFEEDLKTYGVWTNLVDALAFRPRFNPQNGFTFKLGSLPQTGWISNSYGALFGSGPLRFPISPTSNGTIVITWRYPVSDQLSQLELLCGVANEAGRCGIVYLSSAANYQSLATVSNNSYSPTWYQAGIHEPALPLGNYAYDDLGQNNLERRVDVFSWNTNGSVSMWRDGILSKVGLSSPAFTNDVGGISSQPNELILGGDWSGNFANFGGEVESVQIFNCYASSNLASASFVAARELSSSSDTDFVICGDSRMIPFGVNGFPYALQNLLGSEAVIYDFAVNGSSASAYYQSPNFLNRWNLLSDDKRQVQFFWDIGINDFALQNESLTTAWTNALWFGTAVPKNFHLHWGTVFNIATNQSTFSLSTSQLQTVLANVDALNALIKSNSATYGYKVFDLAAAVTPGQLITNNPPGYTLDGVHFYGTNGFVMQKRFAKIAIEDPSSTISRSPAVTFDRNPLDAGLLLDIPFVEGQGPVANALINGQVDPIQIIGNDLWVPGITGFGISNSNAAPTPSDNTTLTNATFVTLIPDGMTPLSSFTLDLLFEQPAYTNGWYPVLFDLINNGFPNQIYAMVNSSLLSWSVWSTAGQIYASYSSSSVTNGQWHDVCISWDGQTNSLWFDGVLRTNVPLTGTFLLTSTNNSQIFIGAMSGGAIGHTRFWNRALSTNEIRQLYRQSFPP